MTKVGIETGRSEIYGLEWRQSGVRRAGQVGTMRSPRLISLLLSFSLLGVPVAPVLGATVFAGAPTAAAVPALSTPEVMAVAAGIYHTCAIVGDAVKCWGYNAFGQTGSGDTVDPQLTPVTSIASGATAVGAGGYHTCAIVSGAVKCWGYNAFGQTGSGDTVDPQLTPVTSIASGATAVDAGAWHTCALVVGAVECWGRNGFGQTGSGDTVDPQLTPVTAIASGATAVDAGGFHTCALVGGAVKCWGHNWYGQTGSGDTDVQSTPVTAIASGATAIAAGAYHTCAIVSGAVKCWGRNDYGQIGIGGTDDQLVPVIVIASGATTIAAGNSHTCAIVSGAVKCWGRNEYGQTGAGYASALQSTPVTAIASGATAVAAGGDHTCAIVSGAVKCWGGNTSGQTGSSNTVSPQLAPVTAIVAGTHAPTATLTRPATPTSAATLSYALTFSESVTGLAASDFTRTGTATGCVVGTPTGSGASYTVPVTSCSAGTVILALKANSVADAASNAGPAAAVTAGTVTIDRTAPTATLTRPATPTSAATLSYALTFSESVTGLAASDFTRTGTATGCVVGTPTGSGASYTVPVTSCSAGTVILALKANSVADAASNAGPAAAVTAGTVTIDRTAPTGATYHALTPVRLLDSRIGNGLTGPFQAKVARTFQVTGRGGVPANAVGVTGNLTVTGQTAGGYLYLGPVATNSPTSSTLNFPLGDTRANGVTVALGSGGKLSVTYMAGTGRTAQVILDVTGYFTPDTTGATYHALAPVRLLDSRIGNGLTGPFQAKVARTFQVTGRGGVPANAIGVTGNLTVTGQTAGGYLYLGPVATNSPTSSTLNFPLGDTRANGVTVALGSGGKLSVTYMAGTGRTAQVIFDVTGYFTP